MEVNIERQLADNQVKHSVLQTSFLCLPIAMICWGSLNSTQNSTRMAGICPALLPLKEFKSCFCFSFPSQEGCSSTHILFVTLHWTLFNISLSLMYWEAQHSTCDFTTAGQKGRITTPDLLAMFYFRQSTSSVQYIRKEMLQQTFPPSKRNTPPCLHPSILSNKPQDYSCTSGKFALLSSPSSVYYKVLIKIKHE